MDTRVDTRADSRSIWSNRDVYIGLVFIQLISLQYRSVIGPSCLKISSAFHVKILHQGQALPYVTSKYLHKEDSQ